MGGVTAQGKRSATDNPVLNKPAKYVNLLFQSHSRYVFPQIDLLLSRNSQTFPFLA